MSGESKILIVYYTRSGTTGRLADLLATQLGAGVDVEAIVERGAHNRRAGLAGYVRCIVDGWRHADAKLMPMRHDLAAYDLVVVATPVWNRHAATPVVTWLKTHGAQLHHVGWLCSLHSRGSRGAFDQMRDVSGKSAIAKCEINADDLRFGMDYEVLNMFARKLRERLVLIESWKQVA